MFSPKSVIDVGCGIGTWTKVFSDNNLHAIGLDGDYIDNNMLYIRKDNFIPCDLTKKLPSVGNFDMVISLEVAEHLPEARAKSFVKELCSLAPLVVFSAAIPYQGGTNHINEKWHDYWVDIFKENGYSAFDCIRPQISKMENVDKNYKNNIIVFCRKDIVNNFPALKEWTNNLSANVSFNRVNHNEYMFAKHKAIRKKRYKTGFIVMSMMFIFSMLYILYR